MEKKVSTEKARQGRWGFHTLLILVCALILAGLVWFGLEIYGQTIDDEPAAEQVQGG